MANLLQLLNDLEGYVELAEVNLDFLNNAVVEQLPPLSPGPISQALAQEWLELAPAAPAPAQHLLEMAMAQAELVPMQAAPALVQGVTVAGAPASELAAQASVQLAPGPAHTAPPPLAAFVPAAPALAAQAMVAGAPAPELAASVQAAGPDAAAAAAPEDQAVVEVFGEGVEERFQIDGRVDVLPAYTVIPERAGDQMLLFKRPVHQYIVSPFVVDEDDLRQWAAQHAAQNLSAADIKDLLPELERRRQVWTGERVAHWVWGPLSQPVTMGHKPKFLKLLALIAFVAGTDRNLAVALVQVLSRISEKRTKELLPQP